jgi:predicted RND superfamily exporter protein/outer membrane lipoprotein-sorting protein
MKKLLVDTSIRFPRAVMLVTVLVTIAAAALIPRIQIDTDPENMLPADQAQRVFHNKVKKDFTLWDMLVVGVLNENDPDGVFNPHSLERVHDLTREIEKIDGVVRKDLMSLSSVDNITQGGPGTVRFEWMMDEPPATREEAHQVRADAQRIPTIEGTLVSEDGQLVAIYVPIVEKSEGHRIATEIEEIVAGYDGDERYFITGLPVAEDTFGVEMFRQMGIAAPLAGLIIFILMFIFFRSLALITAPMIIAVITVTITMGLLIGFGFTVHIMSSMIPIFLMPIAVVDSIHILSEFADLYPRYKDRKKTIRVVMDDLFAPMHFTSLTSAAGFASLALAPIPPVRVFGLFVAFGITLAFYLTVTFIPAYVVRLSDKRIAKLKAHDPSEDKTQLLGRVLGAVAPRALANSKLIMSITVLVMGVSIYGVSQIQINDNPVRWFRPDHRIRVADRLLNEHFAGTYNAFLVLEQTGEPYDQAEINSRVSSAIKSGVGSSDSVTLTARWDAIRQTAESGPAQNYLPNLIDGVLAALDEAESNDEAWLWEDVLAELEAMQTDAKYFQNPDVLRYMDAMQKSLVEESHLVGKTTAVTDIVKTVHRELRQGQEEYYSIPDSPPAVAQTLLSYQSSHRPDDLWHFVTPDLRQALVWVQLKSGDNQDMLAVTEFVDDYVDKHPLPEGVEMGWAGLTYLNVVWQEDMVNGMLNALLGSFVIVFLMMLILFRNFYFAVLAMLPLSVTIAFIYGLIGIVGKDYDMPVAVLSSLTLGLSVDFAIHFLQRGRVLCAETTDWRKAAELMFEEPARAITRNAIVISIGFLPLLASPLVPYNTVGFFLAAIMIVSAVVTLVLLPAVMVHIRGKLFGRDTKCSEPLSDKGGSNVKQATAVMALVAAVLFTASPAQSQDLTSVDEIIDKANVAAYYAGDDGRAQVRMTITDSQGRERRRQFTILRKDVEDGGDQHYAVLFSRPADVRGTVFLVKKHVGDDDDRWLYLPGLDLVKRIAAGDKRTSFVGSHFFYEDVSGRGIDEDTHELVETTEEHYVVKNTPKDPGGVEFAHWTAWIDKETMLPVKMDYTDETGEIYRRIEALEVESVDGHPTVTVMKVSDLRSGGHTVSQFRNIEYDLGISDDVFTERTLRNPPRNWFSGR